MNGGREMVEIPFAVLNVSYYDREARKAVTYQEWFYWLWSIWMDHGMSKRYVIPEMSWEDDFCNQVRRYRFYFTYANGDLD